MRISVLSMTMLVLGACAHQSAAPSSVPAAPLPALSVQRELELKVGYEGAPGTMAFGELSQDGEARQPARQRDQGESVNSRDVAVSWPATEPGEN